MWPERSPAGRRQKGQVAAGAGADKADRSSDDHVPGNDRQSTDAVIGAEILGTVVGADKARTDRGCAAEGDEVQKQEKECHGKAFRAEEIPEPGCGYDADHADRKECPAVAPHVGKPAPQGTADTVDEHGKGDAQKLKCVAAADVGDDGSELAQKGLADADEQELPDAEEPKLPLTEDLRGGVAACRSGRSGVFRRTPRGRREKERGECRNHKNKTPIRRKEMRQPCAEAREANTGVIVRPEKPIAVSSTPVVRPRPPGNHTMIFDSQPP